MIKPQFINQQCNWPPPYETNERRYYNVVTITTIKRIPQITFLVSIEKLYQIWCDLADGFTLHWRHNGHDSVSNHHPHDCLLNRLFRRRSKKISKLRVTGLCAGNSPETGEFPAQMASNAENVSIWWRHHDCGYNKSFNLGCWVP